MAQLPLWLVITLLGIIEGVTEFIPVSSTGHLLLAELWLPRQSDLFNILIQSAAVLAVLPLFKDRLRRVICDWREPANFDFGIKVLAAFFITGVGGLVLDHFHYKLPEELKPVAWALLIGGVLFLMVEAWIKNRPKHEEITWTIVVLVGIGQLIAAIFPGASRSGTTILLALLCGLSRPAATEFSFLVSIPTMLAAGGWQLFKTVRHAGVAGENWSLLILGCIISAIVSFIVVRWMLGYVRKHSFNGFGVYRIIAGAAMLVYLIWMVPK